MLVPPSDTPRAASIMTTASSASAADKTGHTWSVAVTEDNCWDDLILTLGKYRLQCSMLPRLDVNTHLPPKQFTPVATSPLMHEGTQY